MLQQLLAKRRCGSTIVTNGNPFVSTGWTLAVNCNISGGSLNYTSNATGYCFRNTDAALIVGRWYQITYTISSYTGGNVRCYLQATPIFGTTRNAAGTYVDYIKATSTSKERGFNSSPGFTGSITGYSVQLVG